MVGCSGGKGGGGSEDIDVGPTGDTDIGVAACPARVHLAAFACLESTAEVLIPDTGGYDTRNVTGTVSGTVSELGAPASLAESAPVGGFPACDDAERVIRILDGDGETWTVGWAVEGSVDESPDSIVVGGTVDLAYEWQFTGYDVNRNLVLSDTGGPRFVFAGSGLDPVWLEGLAVTLLVDDTCTADGWDETPMEFTATTTLVLNSGESGTVTLGDRELDVVVPASGWLSGCVDGCGTYDWVGWD